MLRPLPNTGLGSPTHGEARLQNLEKAGCVMPLNGLPSSPLLSLAAEKRSLAPKNQSSAFPGLGGGDAGSLRCEQDVKSSRPEKECRGWDPTSNPGLCNYTHLSCSG